MLILVWNVFHGRADPPAGRPLAREFARALAGWEWDVALLQECPPWWPAPLARAAGASQAHRLTSRNEPLAPRRAIARRNPDLLRANGGGCNAILVRGDAIDEQRALRLTRRPERRWAHGVRLARSGVWVVNVHTTTDPKPQTAADIELAKRAALAWAGPSAPLVLAGDFNVYKPQLAPELTIAASHRVDHISLRGLEPAGKQEVLDAGGLSDHRPLRLDARKLAG